MHSLQKPIQVSEIIIKTERDKQNDQIIAQKWRDARIYFFQHQIRNQLRQSRATLKEQESIVLLFTKYKLSINTKLTIDFSSLGELQRFAYSILQLQGTFNQMEQQYRRKSRECMPITEILWHKCSTLKVFNIEYPQKLYQCQTFVPPYSVSAFELFKAVHNNKMLHSVTLKGVEVQEFQQFMRTLNPPNEGYQIQSQRKQLSWINNFRPNKCLKLNVEAKLQFGLAYKQKTYSEINDLMFFSKLFERLSHIKVKLVISNWTQLDTPKNILSRLWQCLRTIKQINIDFYCHCYGSISNYMAPIVRCVLFGGLASFTEIAKLSFNYLSFVEYVSINDFLGMEQNLRTMFQNNAITHLKLNHCTNFPAFPEITTLQSIDIEKLSFRRKFNLMSAIVQNSKSLKSILCSYQNKWLLHEQLFERLQTLIVGQYAKVTVDMIKSKSPSNLKHFTIYKGNNLKKSICCLPMLSRMFAKLSNLTVLSIVGINLGHEAICIIPSPHLQQLHIQDNGVITDQGIKEIDSKWSQLRCFALQFCDSVSEKAWKMCKFKGLKELTVDQQMFKNCKILQDFLRKGIKVNYY